MESIFIIGTYVALAELIESTAKFRAKMEREKRNQEFENQLRIEEFSFWTKLSA